MNEVKGLHINVWWNFTGM